MMFAKMKEIFIKNEPVLAGTGDMHCGDHSGGLHGIKLLALLYLLQRRHQHPPWNLSSRVLFHLMSKPPLQRISPLRIPTWNRRRPIPLVDVCSLATAFDVENVLGQTVTSITPGSEPDDISGGTLNFCTFVGSGQAVVISSVEVENSSFGLDMLNAQVDAFKGEEPDTAVNQELGVGVKAYWSTSEHAGQYTVLTEEHVFAVSLGGNIGAPEDHKAALLTLAQIIEKQQ